MKRFLIQCLLCVSAAFPLSSCMPKLLVSGAGAPVEALPVSNGNADKGTLPAGQDASGHGDMDFMAENNSGMDAHDSSIGQYDFTFKAGGKSVSGFLVMKRELVDGRGAGEPDGIRVLGTTYFGMQLFDITVGPDSYRMNSCADFLNRKPVAAFLASRLRKKFL